MIGRRLLVVQELGLAHHVGGKPIGEVVQTGEGGEVASRIAGAIVQERVMAFAGDEREEINPSVPGFLEPALKQMTDGLVAFGWGLRVWFLHAWARRAGLMAALLASLAARQLLSSR